MAELLYEVKVVRITVQNGVLAQLLSCWLYMNLLQVWHDQNSMYPHLTPPPPEGCGWDQDGTQTRTGQGWNTHV